MMMLFSFSHWRWIPFAHLLLSVRHTLADVDAPCYAPDGSPVEGFFPCDPTAYITSCCPTGWTCYSNSMCVVTDPSAVDPSHPVGTSIRGTCTNPVWNNAVCGDYCLDDGDVDGSLEACGANKFCCASDDSCSCSDGAFVVNPGIVQTIIGIEGLEHTETSTIEASTRASTSTLDTRSSTSALSTSVAPTTAAGSTQNSEPTLASRPPSRKATDKPGVKAGIALGVIFGVALLALGGWFLYRRHRNRQRAENPRRPQPTSEPLRPPSPQDPYIPNNATNIMLSVPFPPKMEPSQGTFDQGDAPYGNEYERDAPSRGPLASSSTTIGSGTLNGGYGWRGVPDRPLSIVSDEEEARYIRPRPSELGIP